MSANQRQSTKYHEVNFDGLIGATHNYGGLSFGNIASANNKSQKSFPKKAALQGLDKAWLLAKSGLKQGILPPQERPFLPLMTQIGFKGDAKTLLGYAAKDKQLLANISAASAMWAANAATVSPALDCGDGKIHFTPANLITNFHRSLEAAQTTKVLRTIFADNSRFMVHEPLLAHSIFADEGAANFMRLCKNHGSNGIEIFVYGRDGYKEYQGKFPARQTRQSFETIARKHELNQANMIFTRQSQAAIDAGAFHNDVVAVANQDVLFYHEYSFEDEKKLKAQILEMADFEPIFIKVDNSKVPIKDAIKSYLFNCQIISRDNEKMIIIAPTECRDTPKVRQYLDELVVSNLPIGAVEYVDVRQSMNNGGGPACLRLRVVMNDDDIAAVQKSARVMLDDGLYQDLQAWINKYYPDELLPEDLASYELLRNNYAALDALTGIMNLGGTFYDFQK